MRLVVGLLAFAGAVNLALADDPPATPASSAAAPAASAPATAATAAAAATKASAAIDPAEKRLMSLGYRPQMSHGQKIFCKREPVLGSRTEVNLHCGTAAELAAETHYSQDAAQRLQQNQMNPPGPLGH